MSSLFDFKDYKQYLKYRIMQQPARGRGFRSKLAEAAKCQVSYVSRVLTENADFSLEQSDAINDLLGHTSEEKDFFLILVQFNRAGTISLKNHFQKHMDEILKKRLVLKERLQIKDTLSREDQATYYSAWYYAAAHILISIPAYQTQKALSHALDLPADKTAEVLAFLESIGLAQRKSDGGFIIGNGRIHLERDSPLISKHHANWRIQAIRAIDRSSPEDLHYSVLVGISDEDAKKIQAMAVEFIKEVMSIVHDSKQQGAHCFTMDLFRV